jgi:hypothetical protein
MKSNKEIRQVLIDYDQSASKGNNSGSALFGTGKAPFMTSACGEDTAKKLLYEGLGVEGSPIVMNIEMNKESSLNPYSDVKTGGTGTKKAAKSSGGAGAGGAKKGKTKK